MRHTGVSVVIIIVCEQRPFRAGALGLVDEVLVLEFFELDHLDCVFDLESIRKVVRVSELCENAGGTCCSASEYRGTTYDTIGFCTYDESDGIEKLGARMFLRKAKFGAPVQHMTCKVHLWMIEFLASPFAPRLAHVEAVSRAWLVIFVLVC